MALQESPSFDDLGKMKPAKKSISPRKLRRVLLLVIALLGTTLLLFSGSKLGSRVDTHYGGLDGCFVDKAGNPVLVQVVYGDQSRETYADGCFFFPYLEAGQGELLVGDGFEQWSFPVEILAEQAVILGEIVLE
jgi:hypothetical protein